MNKIELKLPNKIDNSDIFISEPFCIFEINDVFNKEFYDELVLNFPKQDDFKDSFDIGNKLFLNNYNINFFKFINKNLIYENFYKFLNSPEFLKKIFILIRPELLKINQRQNINNVFLTQLKSKYLIKIIKLILGIFKIKVIKLGFEFSLIKEDCYIPLHTDKSNKLVSLMVYLPNNNDLKHKEEWGTCFYKLKKGNDKKFEQWESEFMDEKNSSLLMKNIDKFFQSKFTQNKLVGFIKTSKSFHNTEKINKKGSLRKSLNINYYIQ